MYTIDVEVRGREERQVDRSHKLEIKLRVKRRRRRRTERAKINDVVVSDPRLS